MKKTLFIVSLLTVIMSVWVDSSYALNREGTIDDRTPFVEIPIDVPDNSTITIDMQATSGNLDSLVYLVDDNGAIVAQNDDYLDGNLDSQLRFPHALGGEYTVIATRVRVEDGNSSGTYELTIDIQPSDVASPLAYQITDERLQEIGFPADDPRPKSDWTLLLYYGADTNLEAGVLNDFGEFERAGGSSENVHIVGLLDRHPEYSTASGDWSDTRLFEVTADVESNDPLQIDSHELANLGDLNTGSGETFAQFLIWGIRNFPAERYGIAFASHGGAWRGIVTDESSNNTILTLPELDAALTLAKREADVERFDLLVNDACSMSSIEYYAQLESHFRLSIASPEVVANPALDMTQFTRSLRQQSDYDLRQLSRELIDTYLNRDAALNTTGRTADYLNYALTNLERFQPVNDAIDEFARIINRDPSTNSALLGTARANAYTYSSFLGQRDKIDLGDFMRQVIAVSADPEIVQAAQNVINRLNRARLYANAGTSVRDTVAYYNIYFPLEGRDFDYEYLERSPLREWGRMLRAYYNATTPRIWQESQSVRTYHPPIAPDVRVTQVFPDVSSTAFPPTISVEMVGRNIADGSFTIDRVEPGGTTIRLAETSILTETRRDNDIRFINKWRDGVDQSVFNWLPFVLPVVTDGETTNNELLRQQDDVWALEGRYRESPDSKWSDVTVLFNVDGNVQNIVSQSAGGGLASITIPVGSTFQAYRFTVTPDGTTSAQPGTEYQWQENGLTWRERPTDSGTYKLGFLMRAFGGVSGFDSVEITVDNSDRNPDLVGYTDAILGINFQYPKEWDTVSNLGDRIQTTSPDGNTAIRAYYFSAEDNVFDIVREAQRRYQLSIPQPAEAVYNQNNRLGLAFDYTYFTESGQTWVGRGVAYHHDTIIGGQGIVFALETRAGTGQVVPADQIGRYLPTLGFHPPAETIPDERWTFELLNNRIPYPIPLNWSVMTDPDGWRQYIPRQANNTLKHIAMTEVFDATPEDALTRLIDRYAPNSIDQQRVYNGKYHQWLTASYFAPRQQVGFNGRAYTAEVAGRLYVTEINARIYALRFETVNSVFAPDDYRQIFEPLVDGVAPDSGQEFTAGTRASFIKRALITADDLCNSIPRNSICYGGGDAMRLLYTSGTSTPVSTPGDAAPIDKLQAVQVGLRDDGTIDPYSRAVIDMQANLPNTADQHMKLVIFGGMTVVNKVRIGADETNRLRVRNSTGERVNIRQTPNANAFVQAALEPAAEVTALARLDDTSWVRVRLPDQSGETGWVQSDFVEPTSEIGALEQLTIGDPNRRAYGAMEYIDVYRDQRATASSAFGGILIQTSPGTQTMYIRINEVTFELPPDRLYLWRADTGTLQQIPPDEQADVFGISSLRRVPGTLADRLLTSEGRADYLGEDIAAYNTSGLTVIGVDGRMYDFRRADAIVVP